MEKIKILTTKDKIQWDKIVRSTNNYDFYHTASYHEISESRGEGKAYLFAYKENNILITIPLLIKPIYEIQGLEKKGKGLYDAISVYGYPGPISNKTNIKQEVLLRFGGRLLNKLHEYSIVTVFSRLNPILQNYKLIRIGKLQKLGRTVYIDLNISLEEQRKSLRKGHKYSIKKAQKEGVEVHLDSNLTYYEDFINLYNLTMDKVGASKDYYFGKKYFYLLKRKLGKYLKLFIAKYEGKIISAALFSLCNYIVQYHLSGSDPKYYKLAPAKLIIDNVRNWATSQHAQFLHLGGGKGSTEDGLYFFKSGFSNKTRDFLIWKLIVNKDIYSNLIGSYKHWLKINNRKIVDPDYFPLYRK